MPGAAAPARPGVPAGACHARRASARVLPRVSAGTWLVCGLVLGYVGYFTWLALCRHAALQTNALDLGYTAQVLWNTAHGRPFQFSTLTGAAAMPGLPLAPFARRDSLLAFHVEPMLLPLSLLYLVPGGTERLLALQALAMGAGALPAYWLARRRLGSSVGGVAFAAAYLLAPALQGASLSDFHAVALSAPLLLLAFWFLEQRRDAGFLACVVALLATREDVPAVVVLLGLYVCIWRRRCRLGLVTAALGLAWLLACELVLLPHFSGHEVSPFLQRLAVFAPTAKGTLRAALHQPRLVLAWLGRPAIVAYLGGLLATAGFLPLLGPVVLGLGAPIIAGNVFSTWSWTYSEGAHYSAVLVPLLIVSGIDGAAALSRWTCWRLHLQQAQVVRALAAALLLCSAYHNRQVGLSPWSRAYRAPRLDAHARLGQALLRLVPADAAVSAQSNLYPHLAERRRAYLFPAVNDATYVLMDVTASPFPIDVQETHRYAQELLAGGFGVVAADDGYLLLGRGRGEGLTDDRLSRLLSFVRPAAPPEEAVAALYGGALELVGADCQAQPEVSGGPLPATVTTYWRVRAPLPAGFRFGYFFTDGSGAIVGSYLGGTPTEVWYPPERWQVGETVRLRTPPLAIGRQHGVLLAVTPPGGDPELADTRLSPTGSTAPVYERRTLLALCRFP
jgi:uncharacterized membrane protein